MKKICLSNGKEIEIKEATNNSVCIGYDTLEDIPPVIREFTEENLANLQIIAEDETILMELENKYLLTVNVVIAEQIMTLWLADVDMTTKRIVQLETSLIKQKEIIAELQGGYTDGE